LVLRGDNAVENEVNYTAKDVLDLYLEFEGMQSDQDTWAEGSLQDNPPRLYRLKALGSLFRAFELGDIKEFAVGTFVLKRKIEDYSALIKQIKSELRTITKLRKGEQLTLKEIAFLFKRLLEYRRRWDDVTGFSSGLYACSAKYRYAFYKIDQVNSEIHDKISPINDILTFIMAPVGKAISKEELVKHFDYPDVDLSDIDDEWL
jgi:hypothetical protein